MSIAICPECGGAGSHEVSRPQRDDPYYAVSEQCRHCGGVGHIEEDGPPLQCDYCQGRGEVGGVTKAGPWETYKCPECGGRA